MTIRSALLCGLTVTLIGSAGACATQSTEQGNSDGLQFSTSTRAPQTAPVQNYREAYDNARRFAVLWVRKDLRVPAWRSQLAELATSDLEAKIVSGAFPVPEASSIRGDIAPRASQPSLIEFVFDTDDGIMAVVTVPEESHWRVAGIRTAE